MHSHTGVNGVSTSLAMLIPQQVARGHDIMLVHRPGSWLASTLSELPVAFVESPLTTRIGDLYRVGDTIRSWGADVVHTHGSTAHKYGAIYRVVGKIPIVATAHACRFQLHWIFNNRIIAPSRRTAEYHRRVNGARRRNMRIIPHMIDTTAAPLVTADRRKRQRDLLCLPEDAFVLGMIGSIDARKNQIDSVRVLHTLRQGGHNAHLVLIGGPAQDDHLAALDNLVAQAGLQDIVHRTGGRPDATDLLPAFDAYICTSRHEEGPIANLEAMVAGLPVISTDVGCMDMVFAEGRGGRIFTVGDHAGMADYAAELAADPTLAATTGTEARTVVGEKLSPDVILPQIDAVYREVASRR